MNNLRHIIFFFLLASCQGHTINQLPELRKSPPVKVEVVTVTAKPMAYEILSEGVFVPRKRQTLHFSQSGVIKELNFKNGEWVQKGDTIAILNNETARIDSRLAQIRKQQAQYRFESEIMSFRITGNLTDTIRKGIQYSSGLATAELEYLKSVLKIRETLMLAGQRGRIGGLKIHKGDLIAGESPLGEVFNPNDLRVNAEVLELHASRITPGMPVKITFMDGTESNGHVEELDPIVDSDGFFNVIIRPDTILSYPGSHVTVRFQDHQRTGYAIPVSAIMAREDKLVVYKIVDNKITWQYIRTGLQTGNLVEVTYGLDAGDLVAVNRLAELAHGVHVEIVKRDFLSDGN